MKINTVLHYFREYNVTYNVFQKAIIINKAIDVKKFVALKTMLKNVEEEIKNIIVEV